jgi:16S rRNA (guanine(966)-N(2))-methyltransferase RsmD
MRIISGAFKGKRISAPKKLPARPTTDMAKEGLFNILNNHYYFDDCIVIDLFSGTGNISYEFASRGSTKVTAVDDNALCIKFIDKTAKELNIEINTVKSDVFKYLSRALAKADIIFADPPYGQSLDDFTRIVEYVFDNNLLLKEGILIIEHSSRTDLSGLRNFKNHRKYGGSVFSFFEG